MKHCDTYTQLESIAFNETIQKILLKLIETDWLSEYSSWD